MPDADPTANRLLALEQELLAQRQRASEQRHQSLSPHSIAAGMSQSDLKQPTARNRLLHLQQSLQPRSPQSQPPWAEANTWHRLAASLQFSRSDHQNDCDRSISKISFDRAAQSYSNSNGNGYSNGNNYSNGNKTAAPNRLLALEQSLAVQSPDHLNHQNGNGHSGSHALSSSLPPSFSSRVIAQAFDFGEAIDLQYNPSAFSNDYSVDDSTDYSVDSSVDDSTDYSIDYSIDYSTDSTDYSTAYSTANPIDYSDTTSIESNPPPPAIPPTAPTTPDLPPSLSPLPSPPAPAPLPPPSSFSNAHSIFDQLGKNMAYATAFDLGTLSLQQRFDEFDRRLDEQDTLPP